MNGLEYDVYTLPDTWTLFALQGRKVLWEGILGNLFLQEKVPQTLLKELHAVTDMTEIKLAN